MTSATVVVLEPESSGLGLVDAAVALELPVHVVDGRPLDAMPAWLGRAVADGRVTVVRADTLDVDALERAVGELADRHGVRAVLPGFEYAVEAAAEVGARLGLPGIAPEASRAVRDKALMKEALEAAGVAVAPWLVLDDDDGGDGPSARAVARHCGYPAVVKPVDGCGSVLVSRVDDAAALHAHVAHARRHPVDDLGRVVGRRLLVEGYVSGPEVSVEGFVSGGTVEVVAVTEKRLGPEPHFVEVGHVVEADVPATTRAALEATTARAVAALGITVGGFHLEARLPASGPVVMEVAARLGGDRIPALVALARGRNLHEAVVRSFVGLPVAAPPDGPDRVAAVRFFTAATAGTLRSPARLLAQVTAVEGCEEAEVYVHDGTPLSPATDFRHRFGHAVVAAPDRGALERRLAEVDVAVHAAVGALGETAVCAS